MNRLQRTCWVAVCAALLGVAAAPAGAQESQGRLTAGLEIGMPLVLGVDVSQRLNERWRVGLALGRMSGLTAIRAEGTWLLREEVRRRFVPVVAFGGEQYFLNDAGRDATPVGVHAAIGLDYHADSPVSFTARLGGMKTFGSSGAGNVKVFGVENGFTTGLFNIGVRVHL